MSIKDLKKHKMWIGLQFSKSLIAKKIKKYSRIYYPQAFDIASHVLAIIYINRKFYVYESTIEENKQEGLNSGCRHYPLKKFLRIEKKAISEYVLYPINFDFKILDENLGNSYAYSTIKDLMLSAILKKNNKNPDRIGKICSEFLADAYKPIQKYYDLKAWQITPAHWQRYCEEQKLKSIKLTN